MSGLERIGQPNVRMDSVTSHFHLSVLGVSVGAERSVGTWRSWVVCPFLKQHVWFCVTRELELVPMFFFCFFLRLELHLALQKVKTVVLFPQ